MDQKTLTEFVQDILITIHENIRELEERKNFADPEELDYIETRLFTYNEILSVFKMSARSFGIAEDEIGI